MDRRAFLGTMAGGLLAAPLAAGAQPGKVYRIGILANIPLTDPEGARLWGAFLQGLRELGYVEGRNITIEWRFSEGKYERLPELAADLVRLKVDVIVAPATQNVAVAEALPHPKVRASYAAARRSRSFTDYDLVAGSPPDLRELG